MNRLVQLTFFLFLCETVEKKKKMQMLNEEEELLDELDRSSEDEREQP